MTSDLMQDWDQSLTLLERDLEQWLRQVQQEFRARRRTRAGLLGRLSAEAESECLQAAQAAAGEAVPRRATALFEALTERYVNEPLPAERAKMRARLGASPRLSQTLWDFAVQSVERLAGDGSAAAVQRALAALSLDDLRTDVRAVDGLLAKVRAGALRGGLDVAQAFENVARISNPGMGGGGGSLREHLRRFARSSGAS
jgi:hypothetical protein